MVGSDRCEGWSDQQFNIGLHDAAPATNGPTEVDVKVGKEFREFESSTRGHDVLFSGEGGEAQEAQDRVSHYGIVRTAIEQGSLSTSRFAGSVEEEEERC